jgi:hypothetical protein
MWARVGPVAGIAGWVISLVGLGIHGYANMGASGQDLARWASTTDPTRFTAGIYVEAVGIILLLVFFAWLCDYLRRASGPSWLPMLAFATGAIWCATGILVNSVWVALLDAGRRGADPQLLIAMRDMAQAAFNASYLFFALAMIAIAVAAFVARSLPTWLSWPAIVIGVGLANPTTTNFASLAVILWTFAIGMLFVLRPPRVETPA